jgi:hypothetical protein
MGPISNLYESAMGTPPQDFPGRRLHCSGHVAEHGETAVIAPLLEPKRSILPGDAWRT